MHGLRHFSQVPLKISDPEDSICGGIASDYLAHARISRAGTIYSILLSWGFPRERGSMELEHASHKVGLLRQVMYWVRLNTHARLAEHYTAALVIDRRSYINARHLSAILANGVRCGTTSRLQYQASKQHASANSRRPTASSPSGYHIVAFASHYQVRVSARCHAGQRLGNVAYRWNG